MYGHTSSVFNNNCLSVPRNPKIDQPFPLYEHKHVYQLENRDQKLNFVSTAMPKKKYINRETTKAFLDFISNIPEYDEVNHLSNKEFYKKLENLKEKQRMYEEFLHNEIKFDGKDSEWIEDYKNLKIGTKSFKDKPKKRNLKPFCTTPALAKILKTPDVDEDEDLLDKEISTKPSSRRSVRIETPSDKPSIDISPEPIRSKSRANLSSAESKGGAITDWEDFSIEDFNLGSERDTARLESKSAPNSPFKTKNTNNEGGITIPKPFQMTVR